MDEIRYIRDVVVTIAAVLLIISMVHWEGGYSGKGLYLGLPISNDKAEKNDFRIQGASCSCDAPSNIDIYIIKIVASMDIDLGKI